MTADPDKNADLTRLLMRLLDDVLTPEETARLSEILREDAGARTVYHDHIETHALLHWEHGQLDELPPIDVVASMPLVSELDALFDPDPMMLPESQEEVKPKADAETTRSPVLGFLGDCFRHGGAFLYRSNVFTLLVAVGVPGLMIAALVLSLVWQTPPAASVARIAQWRDGKGHWNDHGRAMPLYSGMKLFEGQEFRLEAGFAEIAFADGARVVLEAPTTFEARGPNTGFLRVGRLSAGVPPEARDFTIATPLASVVDLGTEFGVAVADDGTAETHVFKGEVVLTTNPTRGSPASAIERLQGGQAARISADDSGSPPRVERIRPSEEAFVRSMPKPAVPKPAVRLTHHGSRDPEAEGWKLHLPDPKTNVEDDPPTLRPADEDGTTAWMMANGTSGRQVQYWMRSDETLNPEVVARSRSKGWILRARIKVEPVANPKPSVCHVRYNDEPNKWILCPEIRADGSQCVFLSGQSSLGTDAIFEVPNSRNRYVDYEVRYNPATGDADVFVDGQRIATGFVNKEGKEWSGVCFGLQARASKARFAQVEWMVVE